MAEQTLHIYKIPKFIAFLTVAFINAMVDLGHKIIIQNTVFKIYDGAEQIMLTAIVNVLVLIPFILVFTPAGFLADRFSKPKIMQWSALTAIIITLLITLGYYQGWFIFVFTMTFILALQSAIYSPAKYGYIRETVGDNTHRLAAANGIMQATTIVAILSGIFIFSILFEFYLHHQNYQSEQEIIRLIAPIGWILVGLSVAEYLLARRLPKIISSRHSLRFNWQYYRSGKLLHRNLKTLFATSTIWLSILGLALFWGMSQTLLATFPAFAKATLNETNTIVIHGLLACSGIGIIIGSLTAGKFIDRHRSSKFIATGAIGLISMLFILPHLESSFGFAVTIIMFGLFGGLAIVPLNTLIQHHAPTEKLGTILAGNNWIQNLTMTGFLLLTLIAAIFNIASGIILFALPIMAITLSLIILTIFLIIVKENELEEAATRITR